MTVDEMMTLRTVEVSLEACDVRVKGELIDNVADVRCFAGMFWSKDVEASRLLEFLPIKEGEAARLASSASENESELSRLVGQVVA